MRLRDGDRLPSHDAVIRVYDESDNVIETHEHGRFQGVVSALATSLVVVS